MCLTIIGTSIIEIKLFNAVRDLDYSYTKITCTNIVYNVCTLYKNRGRYTQKLKFSKFKRKKFI